ncbi:MAG: vWA domain-containing protein [Nitrospirota bacterium]
MNRFVLSLMFLAFLLPFGCETKQSSKLPLIISSTWPPEIKEGEKVEVAKDLLAKNYYVILDSSGSMGDRECAEGSTKSAVSKRAFVEFVDVVPARANLGLLVFDKDGVREIAPLGTKNRDRIIAEVNAVQPGDGTPLHDAVVTALSAIEKQAKAQLGYGEYHLVIVTDGMANPGQEPNDAVNYILNNTPIMIHTIGFCIDPNHPLNQPGRTSYRTAKDPQELIKGLKAVVAESEKF